MSNDDHIAHLTALRANIKHAIRNKESARIGGGTFSGSELQSLLLAVETNLHEAKHAGEEA